jgi:hypothetical protein
MSIWVLKRRISKHYQKRGMGHWHIPLRNPNALILPPSMNIRMSRSSARKSYTEISPDVNPIPTTSMAGDCVRAVTAQKSVLEELECCVGEVSNWEAGKV